jgi:hypothetical protein
MQSETTTTLQGRINHWVTHGYRITSQTPMSAQPVKPKRFNPIEFLATPLYVLEYGGQKEQTMYLAAAADGSITETGTGLDVSRYRRAQDLPVVVKLAWIIGVGAVITVVLMLLNNLGR